MSTLRLSQIAEVIDCEHKTAPKQRDGLPSIRTPNLGRGRLILDGVNRVSEETYKAWTRRAEPRAGDIILGREAPIGNVAIIPPSLKVCLGQRTVLIRVKKNKVDPQYLTYVFLGEDVQARLQSQANGATVGHLNVRDIRGLEIPDLPPIGTQRRIASVLSAYDDLVETNTRRIAILEEMARTLYEEWFVKFRFPGHEKVRMVDSHLGKIPEGWKITGLGSVIDVDKGVSYNGAGLTPDGRPMVNLKNITPGGGFRRDATKPYSGAFKPRHTVQPGDIVVANTDLTQAGNVVGSPAIIPAIPDSREILISHHLYAVRIREPDSMPRLWLYHLMLTPEFRAFAKGYAIGTTVLGLAREGVTEYLFANPPLELAMQFEHQAAPMDALAENCRRREEVLRRTRDLLLPKLISGEVDVSNLEIDVPAEVAE